MKGLSWFFGLMLLSLISNGQYNSQKTPPHWKMDSIIPAPKFPLEHFIVPVALVTYGIIALNNDALRDLDENTQEEIWSDHPHNHTTIDNYLQFAPAVIVYGLNIAGIHGEHNLLDRTSLFVMSNIFLNITVSSLKPITMQLRPDSSDNLSFPSGHTAEAFANAEFLRLEYRHKSIWYGIAGYVIAGFTGYLRMYNNKHFLSDVLAGAGIGILSTDLSYWLYPKVKGMFVRHGMKNAMILPFYHQSVAGLSLSYHLP
jgi:hypothetical protein